MTTKERTCKTFFIIFLEHPMFHFFPFPGLETFIFPIMEMYYSNCKGNADAGISTFKSISDRLGPSVFCRKTEGTRPMREKKDGKVIISRQSRHFNL